MMVADYRTRFEHRYWFSSASGKPYESMPIGQDANNHTREFKIQNSRFQSLNLMSGWHFGIRCIWHPAGILASGAFGIWLAFGIRSGIWSGLESGIWNLES